MQEWTQSSGRYVDFTGSGRPVRARRQPPRRGAREPVPVEAD